MATDVITWTLICSYDNSPAKFNLPSEVMQFDQTTARVYMTTVTVGFAAEEDIALPTDITTPGWCMLRNRDAANFVTWGPKSGGVMVPIGRLEAADLGAGDFAIFRFSPTGPPTLRMQADTANVEVQIIIWAS